MNGLNIKKFRCPSCSTISRFSGAPGERRVISCPQCNAKGVIQFPGGEAKRLSRSIAIEVSHLRKVYGNLIAVNDISFTVRRGEIFAFLGPNGAGKTTTVEMIESIREPTAGNIRILGRNIKKEFKSIKDRIGILPQEFHSFERLTVKETLKYFAALYDKHVSIPELIKSMDLTSVQGVLYQNLSGGLKQRVGVAIALVNDPEIVFLDEPSTGLDPKARREAWEIISSLRKKGKTVFLTTHYMEEAEYLADHVAIIHKGRIIAEGSPDGLIDQYGSGSLLHIKKCQDSAALDILKEQGFQVRSAGNGDLVITIDNKERVLEVLSELRHSCIEYKGVDIRRSNLEEVFLRLTGARLSEENT